MDAEICHVMRNLEDKKTIKKQPLKHTRSTTTRKTKITKFHQAGSFFPIHPRKKKNTNRVCLDIIEKPFIKKNDPLPVLLIFILEKKPHTFWNLVPLCKQIKTKQKKLFFSYNFFSLPPKKIYLFFSFNFREKLISRKFSWKLFFSRLSLSKNEVKTGNHFWLYIYEDIFLRFLHTTKKFISLSSFLKLDFKKNFTKNNRSKGVIIHSYI